jgi:hypothetical protein
MRIGGKWVGFGLGPPPDEDPKIVEFKKKLKKKFSYAKQLDDSAVYTEELALVVIEAQGRWSMPKTGIIDYQFQVKMRWIKPPSPPRPRGTLYTCQGTLPSTIWSGPPADTARMVEDLYYWQPIGGPYEAFPMNNSIDAEKSELRVQISKRPLGDPINLAGYSQGAIVLSEVFEEMRNPSDSLHYRLPDVQRAVTWGNPSRELGVNNGNKFCGYPADYPDLGPDSRGIMENARRMSNTPDQWMDFAHKKDMYCDTPNTDAGEDQTAICMIVMGNWWGGPDSILAQIFEVVQRPMIESLAMFKAIVNAGMFFGGGIKPHVTYNVAPAIAFLRS